MPAPVRGGRGSRRCRVGGHHMNIESSDFPSLLRAHVELQGTTLTAEELSHVGECYPRCRGKDLWDVREYASATAVGAREHRVVPGSSPQAVYPPPQPGHAAAPRAALH